MQHFEAFVTRPRFLLSQRLTLCLTLTMAFWLVLSSANLARALNVTPTTLSFVAAEEGPNPPSQSLTITTPGSISGSWFASSSGSWLQVIPHTGTTPDSAFVSANVAGLAAGTYTGTILFIARGSGVSRVISVSLTVIPKTTQSQ